MSILKRLRGISKFEFYTNAINLRREMTVFLLKDMGMKRYIRNLKIDTKNMDPEDEAVLAAILDKYSIERCYGEYPAWIIMRFRDSIWDLLRELHLNITKAYTLYASNIKEARERRTYQNRAIANCESLIQELHLATGVLQPDVQKYKKYVAMLTHEIVLLKGWRKSDNKRMKKLLESDINVD